MIINSIFFQLCSCTAQTSCHKEEKNTNILGTKEVYNGRWIDARNENDPFSFFLLCTHTHLEKISGHVQYTLALTHHWVFVLMITFFSGWGRERGSKA